MKYQYWFDCVMGQSYAKKERVASFFGGAQNVYMATKEELYECGCLEKKEVDFVVESRKTWQLEDAFLKLGEMGINFTSVEESSYPKRLINLRDRPYALYFKGHLPSDKRPSVAMVGARACSEYGKGVARHFASLFAKEGVQVISGMAIGIDNYSHLGVLDDERDTYAVLGCGVDICYPKSAAFLFHKIPDIGGIISEYPPGTQPLPLFFPLRNRIISGLSDAVIVVEAKKKSGSLITADFALEQGRSVYAIPGRVTDPLSNGTNRLIMQGAGIITSFADCMEELRLESHLFGMDLEKKKNSLEKEESLVYACLDLLPKNMDELMKMTALPMGKLREILFTLSKKGLVKESFPNFFGRCF